MCYNAVLVSYIVTLHIHSGCKMSMWRQNMETDHQNLTLTVLVVTIDARWEGIGDVGSVRYEPALLPPCPTIRVLSCSN